MATVMRNKVLNGFSTYSIFDIITSRFPLLKKILCLHGGGGSAFGFSQQSGMAQLIETIGDVQFIFAESPHPGGIWFDDGKESDVVQISNLAIQSINYLDSFIATNGPFYGVLGYSQGVAMCLAYLSSTVGDPSLKLFNKVILCNGYFPLYNLDLVDNMSNASPLYHDALIFAATNDFNFYTLSLGTLQYFFNPILVTSQSAGHALPTTSDSTFNDIVSFITS